MPIQRTTAICNTFKIKRLERAEVMTKRLHNLGVSINFNDVVDKAGSAPITRPHIAQVIMESGYVSSTKDAFNLYIGDSGPAFEVKAIFLPSGEIWYICSFKFAGRPDNFSLLRLWKSKLNHSDFSPDTS